MRIKIPLGTRTVSAKTALLDTKATPVKSWGEIAEESPNKNCPVRKMGKHYILREECSDLMPRNRGMDYVDSDIMFMNYHEDGFGVCVSRDKDLCDRMNYDLSNRILHYYMPVLSEETFDKSAVEQVLDFFEHEYPHRHQLKQLYGRTTYEFLRNNARIIANFPYLSMERKKAYFLQFSMIFTFDDIAEHLTTLEDKRLLQAYRHNAMRILRNRTQSEKKILLSHLSNFPSEYVEKSELQEQLQADISQRLLRHGGPLVQMRYAESFEYYLTGVDVGREIVAIVRDGCGNMYTHDEYMQGRCHSAAGILVTSASMDECDAVHYSPHDGSVTMVDLGMVTEADLTSYHREKSYDKYYGRLVTCNYLDWPVLVGGKSVMRAARESVILHNHIVRHLENMLPLVPGRHRQRYTRCLHNILICNDYSFYVGMDQVNTRYGWYPIRKQDAVFNLDKYTESQTIGRVAEVNLQKSELLW